MVDIFDGGFALRQDQSLAEGGKLALSWHSRLLVDSAKASPINFFSFLAQFHPLITTGLAPITILVILNVRICKGIMLLQQRRTNRNAKEINMTYIAIAIVTLFVVFNLPR